MKYFNIKALNASVRAIREGSNTNEHVTARAGLGLVRNYFPLDKYAVTPEQIQEFTRKKPDLAIQQYNVTKDTFTNHCYVEFKSLVGVSIDNIPQQLFKTLFVAIDDMGMLTGNFSTFMIAMKGVKIAFYIYHSFAPLLNDYGIPNYNGFIPLNYRLNEQSYLQYMENTNAKPVANNLYNRYVQKISEFTTDPAILKDMGALETKDIGHPHVLDLLNEKHKEDIHNLFVFVRDNAANTVLL